MEYVIGIDGGGTKTKGLLADEYGNVLAGATVGPSNPNVVKEKKLAHVFQRLFSALRQNSNKLEKINITLFAGISGAGNSENEKILLEIIKKHVPAQTAIKVETDAINALYAGTWGRPGIVQISGTGSITFGRNGLEKEARVGGWGYLFGDEGSGYDIGRRGVAAALKAFDGRGDRDTKLLDMLYAHFQVDHPQDLIRQVYTSPSPKNEISPLAEIVFQAYKQNDRTARKIIAQTVDDLALNITTLMEKLFSPDEKTIVVLSGGIFQEKEIIPALLQNKLDAWTNLTLCRPQMSPAGGALIGAYLMKEKRINETMINNIIHTE
ncbi:N-acetylglucosamine kinase [Virgibacillus kimchii]